ncbi:GntR family transcriptional regulator [Aliikangiella marina]|uniref:GntR family transcriptional regulator n=2 Tax=Aliikangiella marina TaxID=1712262 RepID=A0A545TK11_9GAMM|nr:GntR family transcriptional regulator [Aliikangiella marina]
MYLQIIEQIKRRISIGDWPAGHKLPSIREFAVSLRVSVITVKRAYQELESEGVITTQHGKGSFVSIDSQLDEQLREKDMNQHLVEAIKIAESLGLSEKEIKLRIEQLYRQSSKPKTTNQS